MPNFYWMYVCQSIQWSEVLGGFLGALVGFMSAYAIFQIEQRARRKQEERDLTQRYDDIRSLIISAASGASKARDEYGQLARACMAEPNKAHPWPVHINTALRTLDRMDREVMLKTLRHANSSTALNVWRGILRFIDGFTEQLEHQREALLRHAVALDEEAKKYEAACHDLQRIIGAFGSATQRQHGSDHPLVSAVHRILSNLIGQENMDRTHLYVTLVEPSGHLIRDGLVNLDDGFPIVEAFSKARACYTQYAKINGGIKEDAERYSKAMKKFKQLGDQLDNDMPSIR